MYARINLFNDRLLIVTSQEPAPKKKSKSKTPQRTSQYGGAGSFVPFDSSPNRSHPVSRMPSTGSFDQSSTYGAANSSLALDLYQAPYEKRTSSTNLSVVESVTQELENLEASGVRQRRDTFPVRSLMISINFELHMHLLSLEINIIGPHQPRGFNTKPSTDRTSRIKDLRFPPVRAASPHTRIRACNPLPSNNREDHGIAFQIPQVPQVL